MPPPPNRKPRQEKLYNSRVIRSEVNDESFKEGKLSVPDFLSAREFEIKSFELSQLKSRYASSTRCFQSLPRSLRRRAASHNVKRIPKRLRNKALREMQNTVNGVPPAKKHARGRELYRLKMAKKLLKLASRVKVMRSLPDSRAFSRQLKLRERIKALNLQIQELQRKKSIPPLNNRNGAFDNTGVNCLADRPKGNLKYFKRQQEFVWLPTHIWHAKRFHMIKKWSYQIPLSPTQKSFKAVNRAAKIGSIAYETSYYDCFVVELSSLTDKLSLLGYMTNLKGKLPQKIVDGITTYEDWLYLDGMAVAKGLVCTYRDQNRVLARLHPSIYGEYFEHIKSLNIFRAPITVYDCRYSLGSIEVGGPRSLESLSKILHLNSTNQVTRTWFKMAQVNDGDVVFSGATFCFDVKDPRFFKSPVNVPFKDEVDINDLIIDLQSNAAIDPQAFHALLDSEKREQSYSGQMTTKELCREFSTRNFIDKESNIPILITKLRTTGNWCLICPWFWTLPIWLKLNRIHHIKQGGIKQLHQVNFENGRPLYPIDYPFLKEGHLENILKMQLHEKRHKMKPVSKRPNFGVTEPNINPFGCDWSFLRKLLFALKSAPPQGLSTKTQFATFKANSVRKVETVNDVLCLVKQCQVLDDEIPIVLIKKNQALTHEFFSCGPNGDKHGCLPCLPILQVNILLLGKGTVRDNARLYKIPPNEFKQYLSRTTTKCPCITNLVGFVSSGTFNLNLGSASGVGCIAANTTDEYLLVRNVGASTVSVCNWWAI